jgi:hypothetical protein
LIFVLLFAVVISAFQYRDALAESDLYRVLVGLLDGENSGAHLASPLHYDPDFGFGYITAFYAFADPATLRDPDKLMSLMNQVGFWFMLAGLLLFWCAVRLVHGARVATIALIIFALGPMIPELATSGHQAIPMFAFLCAGACLLFLPLTGWRAVLAAFGGWLFLLAGILTRGEIFLAFPWIVLSRIDTRSVRGFFVSGMQRSIAPAMALVVFFILQHATVATHMGSYVGNYYGEFYTWANVIPGLVYMAVGCGLATALAGGIAAVWLAWQARPAQPVAKTGVGLAAFLGPAALVLVPLVFFDPNPMPTRHFMLSLAGFGILIGMVLTTRPAVGRVAALSIAVLLGVADQVLAELARPTLLAANEAHSPYRPVWPGYQTATHANLGWEWKRHAALVERRALWQALGNELATSCSNHTLVLSDEGEQLFSRLYAGGVPVQARRITIGPMGGIEGIRRGKTFIVMEKMHAWPQDPLAIILADPAYKDYKLLEDPYSMSIFDKTPVPPDRAATFGCSDSAG